MMTTDILAAYLDLARDDVQEALHYAADAVRERDVCEPSSRGAWRATQRSRATAATL
jgi:hypothetical protein